MDLQNVAAIATKLHPYERIVLPLLKQQNELSAISKTAKMQEIEVMRALQWLENKGIITINTEKKKVISLDQNGSRYQKEGLPEEQFLNLSFPLLLDEIKDVKIKLAFEELQKRKNLLNIEEQKTVTVTLTEGGKKVAAMDLGGEVVNRITAGMLKSGSWKEKQFRAYDVEINVPKTYGGKKHFTNEAVEYIKRIWLDMGFQEMTGNFVQSAFWDLDALFVPQDHPAREMQDTFYLDGKAKLP